MQIPKIKIRLHHGRMSPGDVARYPELNEKILATLASKGARPRYIKRGQIFHCKAGPEEQLRQEVIINTAWARIDSTHEGDK